MTAHMPPKERTIKPPKNGWKAHTVYLVEVSYSPSNPIHKALLHMGFLNDGKPGAYCEIWCNNYGSPERFGSAHYLAVLKELTELGGVSKEAQPQ